MNKLATTAISTALATGVIMGAAAPSHAGTPIRMKAMSTAAKQKGDPYKYGATGANAFDCSGLVFWSYKQHGKKLPRTAQAQYNKAKKISAKNRKPGDLIFIGKSSKSIYHVGIFAGVSNGYGYMWDAPRTGRNVGKHKVQNYTGGSPKAFYGRY